MLGILDLLGQEGLDGVWGWVGVLVYCAGLFLFRVSFILQFVCWGLTCSFFVFFGVFSVEIDGCVKPRPTPVRLMD